jgi:hypothetical protein
VAGRRLRPLGIPVVHAEGAPDNASQSPEGPSGEIEGRLPFRDASFHLVTNRHEAFVAAEVARILTPGGCFLTQQIENAWADDFYRLLGLPVPAPPPRQWNLALAVAQVEAAGLQVVARGEADECRAFLDVGALAWHLTAIPWAIPDFSIDAFRPRLEKLHARIAADGPLWVRMPHFWLEARKPLAPG